jgi:hypothetical protein
VAKASGDALTITPKKSAAATAELVGTTATNLEKIRRLAKGPDLRFSSTVTTEI